MIFDLRMKVSGRVQAFSISQPGRIFQQMMIQSLLSDISLTLSDWDAQELSDSTFSPHFSPGGEMIAQIFGFTRDFPKKWNISVYFRLRKISCGFKEQARAHPSGEKCGLKGW